MKRYTNWDEMPTVLTLREVCSILQLSDQTVRKLIHSGRIKATNSGHAFLIPKESVKHFLGFNE